MPVHGPEEPDSKPDFRPVAETSPVPEADPVLVALHDLAEAADRITAIAALIRQCVPRIRTGREVGTSYREILAAAPRPLIGAVLTDAVTRFEAAGTRYRQIHGRALQQEGMTLQEIAGMWGLTRQRISELLQTAGGQPDGRRPLPPAGGQVPGGDRSGGPPTGLTP